MDEEKITFIYKDYADHDQQKRLTLDASEFIRRFMLHIVPNGFMRLRHYGLLANRWRKKKLARCRELLHQREPEVREAESVPELLMRIAGIDITLCPICERGHLQIIETLPPKSRYPPATGPPRSFI